MATSKTQKNCSDFEEYIRDLLECPVCMDTIKSVPVYQCTNGHVICKDCIEKLNNCPICRNDSAPVRSLKLENIVQKLKGVQPGNRGYTAGKPTLQKWGEGSVRSYGTINGQNQESHIELNLQVTPEPLNPLANNQEAFDPVKVVSCIFAGFWGFVVASLIIFLLSKLDNCFRYMC